jgi:RNA polymerase sigma-70 factor (ECF subfamily)
MPAEPEVIGLLALILYVDSRREARLSDAGELVLLADQDRSRWNCAKISEADALLRKAERHCLTGPCQLQAQIAGVHAHAETASAVDWPKVVRLYEQLESLQPSPVIALNRAVAVSFAAGPSAALELLDSLTAGELAEYYPFHLARADALRRLGRIGEATAAYEMALSLTRNSAEQRHLRVLIASTGGGESP